VSVGVIVADPPFDPDVCGIHPRSIPEDGVVGVDVAPAEEAAVVGGDGNQVLRPREDEHVRVVAVRR
jgi:hypothetical protein